MQYSEKWDVPHFPSIEGYQGEDAYGGFQLVEGGGYRSDGVRGGAACGGEHVSGSGSDTQVGKGLPWYWPRGGDIVDCGRDFKSPDHSLHHLPRLPPRILGRSRHRYHHPQGQNASAVSSLEVGGRVCELPGPAQGV